MNYLTLPMQLDEDGQLKAGAPFDSVAALIRASVRTPCGEWLSGSSFGIADRLQDCVAGIDVPKNLRAATEILNDAISDLTGGLCTVNKINAIDVKLQGKGRFEVHLLWPDNTPQMVSVEAV